MKLYRFRKFDRACLEIENHTFRFSDRKSLNDPIEGYVKLYWQGDAIAWEGLFRNYINSLYAKLLDVLVTEENISVENVILLDVNEDVKAKDEKNIDTLIINDYNNFKDEMGILSLYPQILNDEVKGENLEFFINVTNDINKKTEANNSFYEKVFSKKYPIVTYTLIALNIIMFVLGMIGNITGKFDLYALLAVQKNYVREFELHRLITGAFLHADVMHLICNMYSLYILGPELESFIGKKKFTFIYFISLLSGNLLATVTSSAWCVGASGAIFGLLGGLLYFGYYYRIYLGGALRQQIIPVIVINLFISFLIPSISLSAHIGGLVGGLFAALAVGIEKKSNKTDNVNGIIVLTIFLTFLFFMLFR